MSEETTYFHNGALSTEREFVEYVNRYGDHLIAIHQDYLGEFGASSLVRLEQLTTIRQRALRETECAVAIVPDESLQQSVDGLAGEFGARFSGHDDEDGEALEAVCNLAAIEAMLRERDGAVTVNVYVRGTYWKMDLVTNQRTVLAVAPQEKQEA